MYIIRGIYEKHLGLYKEKKNLDYEEIFASRVKYKEKTPSFIIPIIYLLLTPLKRKRKIQY